MKLDAGNAPRTGAQPTRSWRTFGILGLMLTVVLSAISVAAAAPISGVPSSTITAPAGMGVHTLRSSGASLTHVLIPSGNGISGALRSALAGVPGAPVVSPAPLRAEGPTPASSSTASNWAVVQHSAAAIAARDGTSNQSLLSAQSSYSSYYNGTGSGLNSISKWFWSHGFSSASRSSDGGFAWSTNWVPPNATWTTPGSPTYGDIGLGASSLVTSGGSPSTAYYAEVFETSCFADGLSSVSLTYCNSTARIAATGGIAISKSTNGGLSWGVPQIVVPSQEGVANLTGPVLTACGYPYLYVIANQSFAPDLTYNGANNHLTLTWENFSVHITNLQCVSGNLYGNIAENLTSWIMSSSNGGTSWSTPAPLGYGFYFNPFIHYISGEQPSIAVGPAPAYRQYALLQDPLNATIATGASPPIVTTPLAISRSADNGSTWSQPSDISNLISNVVNSSNPARFSLNYFYNLSGPKLAVDNWSGSSHKGNLYVTWEDNRTSSLPGTPSIAFSRSTDGGTTWSNPVNLSLGDTTSHYYFLPSISVGPTGQVWVVYLGESLTPTAAGLYPYEFYGVTSSDGGSTWSPQFAIADSTSSQTIGAVGGAPSVVATSDGADVLWTDCRGVSCPTATNQVGWTVFSANLHAVPFGVTGPTSANVSVNALGVTISLTLPGSPVLENGSTLSISLPTNLPDNATYVFAYTGVSGFGSGTSNPVFVTYAGRGDLVANYVPTPAGWITGTIGPVTGPYAADLVVTINGAPLTTFTAFNGSAEAFNVTEAASYTYTLAATETAYAPVSYPMGVARGVAIHRDMWLSRLQGYLNGTVAPHSATLQVNGSAVAVDASTGIFSDHLAWGVFLVTASAPGFPAYSRMVTVVYGTTTPLIVSLAYGWINGTISPGTGHLSINNVSVPVLPTGSFAQNLSGGSYYVVGTLAGYSWYHSLISLAPGASVRLTISLTNRGWINGTAGPAAALAGSLVVTMDGRTVNVGTTGAFSSYVFAGKHALVAGAPGYYTLSKNFTVTAGNMTNGTFTLNKIPTTCTPPNCPNNNPPPPSSGLSSSTLLLLVGLGAVAAVVAGLLAVMLIRRRRVNEGREGGAEPREPQPYPEEPASESGTGPNPPSGGS